MFIPANLEQGKIVTTAVYGGNVVAIDGNYDDVNRLCAELAGTYPWAFVNVNVRTFYAEGSKTLAFETAEQLGLGGARPRGGAGGQRLAAHQDPQGLRRAAQGRACSTRSRRSGCRGAQALGCSPVRAAWLDESDTIKPVKPDTIAKSLAIGNPADGYFALDAVRQTGGGFAAVTDDEVVDAMRLLARTEGIFAETAGGVTIATLKRLAADGTIRPDERVVAYITGHGLKTLDAVVDQVGPTATIAPTLDAFHAAFPPDRPGGATHGCHRPHPHAAARALRRRRRGHRRGRHASATVLAALDAAHPGFGGRLFDDSGELRRFVNVFVADEDIRFLDGIDTAVEDGQVVSIVPAVAGG